MDERRQHARIRSQFEVPCKVTFGGRWYYLNTKDVSGSGIRMGGTTRIEPGTEIKVTITFPKASEAIQFEAVVVWCDSFMKAGTQIRMHGYEVGARFLAIDEKDRKFMLNYGSFE